jgi:uncharacterized membrane protein YqjE
VAERTYNEKSIAELLHEMKNEMLAFVSTRYDLLAAELREKSSVVKKSAPMLVAAIVFGMGTFATLTFTLVSLICAGIRLAFPAGTAAAFAWPIAAIIICVIYGCVAAALANAGLSGLRAQSLVPERTMRVLRQDQQWLENETANLNNDVRAA